MAMAQPGYFLYRHGVRQRGMHMLWRRWMLTRDRPSCTVRL